MDILSIAKDKHNNQFKLRGPLCVSQEAALHFCLREYKAGIPKPNQSLSIMDLLQSVTPASMALHEPPLVKYLHLSDRSIAYRHLEGKSPTLIYVGGFLSTMEIHKATIIEQYAKVHGRASIRYDQEMGYSIIRT